MSVTGYCECDCLMIVAVYRFTFVSVRDFAEGYSHACKNQHQSKYYSQPYTNLYPIVLTFDARDLNDLFFTKYGLALDGAAEKKRILAGFEGLGMRPLITVAIMVSSPDTKKQFAFVKHVEEKIILPFVREIGINGPNTFKVHYVRSDGCSSQFTCKDAFWWMSQYFRLFGMHLDWSYFCSTLRVPLLAALSLWCCCRLPRKVLVRYLCACSLSSHHGIVAGVTRREALQRTQLVDTS